jgi:hypothetical protein
MTTPSQLNLVEMAKHGHPDAIEALINRSVQTRGIRITASRVGDGLTLIAESDDHGPDRDFLIEVVRKGFANLNSHKVRRVFVRGYLSGQPHPLWRETLMFDVDDAGSHDAGSYDAGSYNSGSYDSVSRPSISRAPVSPPPTMATTRSLPRSNASPTLNLAGGIGRFFENHPSFIATLLLAGVCVGSLGQWLAPKSIATTQWEYHFEVIEVPNDETKILKAMLIDLGSEGWELSHMKQSNIKDRNGKLVTYEGIFKRPLRQGKR